MTAATLVFVGPTLPAAEVAARLPDARVLPPVAVGDVLALVRGRARIARIAIIDGYFERMAAVWHKELLLALERGIAVYGAASMGALRAAELAPFGMVGTGAIYRAFVRGAFRAPADASLSALVSDDEVAVAHLPAEQGFRAVSDALVNLRHGLALAQRRGLISARTHAALISLARARFYRERSWPQLLADGRTARLPASELARLAAMPKPDLKRADALLLLRTLADTRAPKPPKIRVPRTWALGQLAALRSF
jgi:hypothetical protein